MSGVSSDGDQRSPCPEPSFSRGGNQDPERLSDLTGLRAGEGQPGTEVQTASNSAQGQQTETPAKPSLLQIFVRILFLEPVSRALIHTLPAAFWLTH